MTKQHPVAPQTISLCVFVVSACFSVVFSPVVCSGQSPYEKHHLTRGNMPPGLVADSYRMANPELNYHLQPVRVLVPENATVDTGVEGGFVESYSDRVNVGMMVGPVYRFKVSRIPMHFGKELYPSIEILGKLNPPEGLEHDFPIEVHITQDDLEQALDGRMVTKVIYLENPNTALPHRHVENDQPYFDVGGLEDPLRAAERLGRPMAIMRIGSRIPTHTEDDAGFGFHSPSPVILTDLRQIESNPYQDPMSGTHPYSDPNSIYSGSDVIDWSQAEQIDDMEVPRPFAPPIVPGEMAPVPTSGE